MKKTLFTAVLLTLCMTASAQLPGVKIAPKYQKGDTVMYRTTMNMNAAGQDAGIVAEERYVVTDANADGYTIEQTVVSVKANEGSSPVARLLTLQQEAMVGAVAIYTADKDGAITSLRNADELKAKVLSSVDAVLNNIYKERPEAAQMMPKEVLKSNIAETVTEKQLLKSLKNNSPFALNGKTIMTGSVENSENNEGLKVRNLYFLTANDGSKVKVTTTLNMTPEETKQLIIEQVKKLMPEQAEMIEQNIDAVMKSGMVKFDLEQTADYEFAPTGWLKTLTTDMKQNTMGQSTTVKSIQECIYSNR